MRSWLKHSHYKYPRQALVHWDGMSLYGQKKRHPHGWHGPIWDVLSDLWLKTRSELLSGLLLSFTLRSRGAGFRNLERKSAKWAWISASKVYEARRCQLSWTERENSPGWGHLHTMNLWAAPYHLINRQKCAHVTFDPDRLHHPAVDLHKWEEGWRMICCQQRGQCQDFIGVKVQPSRRVKLYRQTIKNIFDHWNISCTGFIEVKPPTDSQK